MMTEEEIQEKIKKLNEQKKDLKNKIKLIDKDISILNDQIKVAKFEKIEILLANKGITMDEFLANYSEN